jgi:NAD(P)-dependent dehydrogenase (short-subunit alcohol dehydrogenase family)
MYRDLFNLGGKTAIVTGAVGILGRHFCEGLAEFGANVVVVDLLETACNEFASDLGEKYGIRTLGLGCDVSIESSVSSMVDRAISEMGPIHVLHNNAATKTDDLDAFFGSVEEYRLDQWRKVMSVNLDGMFAVASAVGAHMVSSGSGGSIIQTASIYGLVAPDQRIYEGSEYMGRPINTPAVYSASKAGVLGLTRYLAAYWGEQGIRVNALVPGGVGSGQNNEFARRYAERVPLGRMAEASEMVGALVYLASDASRYVTGQALVVDGGLSAW